MAALPRCVFALLFIPACSFLYAAPPTDAELEQAVRDLSDKRFAVREKASKLLWQAGAAAEPHLKKAEQSSDAETARRAHEILEKFRYGLFVDTPRELALLIEEYRGGDREARKTVVGKMVALGKPGFDVVQRLLQRESDTDRAAIFAQVTQDAPRGVARSILAGDHEFTLKLLQICLTSELDEAPTNYAAYHYFNNSVDSAINRWLPEWNASKSKNAGVVLVHLYRVKGDFAAAGKIAAAIPSDSLVEQLLWEQSSWKQLAQRDADSPRDALSLGFAATVQRLAGDPKGFEKSLAAIRKLAESDDRFDLRTAAEAMLLNGQAKEAIELLSDRKKNVSLAFDLLCSQMRYKDAFALAAETKLLDGDEEFRLDLRRARMWYVLGDKDLALQTLNRLAGTLKEPGQSTSARDLIKVLIRLMQRDRAAEVCGNYLAAIQQNGATSGWGELLEPLFGQHAEAAEVWWNFLARKSPKEDPASRMRKIVQLFEGKPVKERDDWAAELATAPAVTAEYPASFQAVAAADVLRLAGKRDEASKLLEASIKIKPTSAACLRLGDLLADAKRYKEAAQQYESAFKADPGSEISVYLNGWALAKDGQEKEGKRLMDLSHWLPLGNESARGKFADELERRGFADAAARERGLVLTVGWYRQWHVGNVLNHAARQAIRKKYFDKAADFSEKALAGSLRMGASYVENSAYLIVPQAILQLHARALLAKDKPEEALKLIHGSLEVLPNNLELILEVVPPLEKVGRKKDADELCSVAFAAYEKLARDYPNSAFLHNSYSWLAANCRRELDRALEHAEAAVKLEPKAAGYIDTLAEVHFRRGDKAKAIELMKQCAALEPKSAYYRKQLDRFAAGDINSPVPETDEE